MTTATVLVRVFCDKDYCPARRTGVPQTIGEVSGSYRLKCPRCRQFTEGTA